MTKRENLRWLALCLITASALLGVALLTQSSRAQGQRKFKPGEMVETGGGMWVKILGCRGAGDNEECEVQYYRGDAPESTQRWENASFLRTAEERVLTYKQRQSAEQPGTQSADRGATQPAAPAAGTETETNETTAADCSFIAPPADTSKTAKPSDQLFKRKIYDLYNIIANGTGSAPLEVGVTFLSFQVNRPFINIVRVDPARGALRINDAAPVNATIYPVRSEHIVCEQYRDGTHRRRVANKYACFKNRDGEWVCGSDGIPKITQLN